MRAVPISEVETQIVISKALGFGSKEMLQTSEDFAMKWSNARSDDEVAAAQTLVLVLGPLVLL